VKLDNSKEVDNEYDTWILLSRVYHMIANLRRMELAKYEILPVQAYVLLVIDRLGNEVSPSELSRYVYQQKSTVSDILTRMAKQGLIKKYQTLNGKSRVSIRLTKKGKQVLKVSGNREYLHKIMSYLAPQKTSQLVSCLEILRDSAMRQLSLHELRRVRKDINEAF
jgi:DNA-binding MarR family transcriptional regulator